MADKSVVQKLLVKPGYRLLILNAPAGYEASMGELPASVTRLKQAEPGTDFIQIFLKSRKELEAQLPALKKALKPGALLWVTYPKGTSGVKADINRDSIRAYADSIGLTAVAQVAVDDTWSALRLKLA